MPYTFQPSGVQESAWKVASFVHLTQHSLLPQCLFASLSTVCLHQEEKRMELKPDLKQEVKSVILRDHSMFLRNFNVGSTASSQIGHVEHFILQRAKRFTTNTILPKLVMKHTRVRKSNLKKSSFQVSSWFSTSLFFFFFSTSNIHQHHLFSQEQQELGRRETSRSISSGFICSLFREGRAASAISSSRISQGRGL